MFGEIQFENFDAENGPAEAKKAWANVPPQVGATFKPIKYFGDQTCKGKLYWFLVEETTTGNPTSKRFVVLAVNVFQDRYAIIPSSIHEVKFEI